MIKLETELVKINDIKDIKELRAQLLEVKRHIRRYEYELEVKTCNYLVEHKETRLLKPDYTAIHYAAYERD